MKKTIIAAALVLSVSSIALMATAAHAEEAAAQPAAASNYGTFSGTLTGVSDYRFRGISQTRETPAIQGSFDWEHDSGLYAGVWASNVDFNDGDEAQIETDLYAGYKFEFSGLSLDLGGLYYMYPGADSNLDYDYFEAKAAVGYTISGVDLSAAINYSPENFGDTGDATYVSLGASTPILDTGFSLSGTYGHQWLEDEVGFGVPDYNDWSLGLGYSWQGFDFGLTYVDTDLKKSECADGCDATAIFSIGRSFN